MSSTTPAIAPRVRRFAIGVLVAIVLGVLAGYRVARADEYVASDNRLTSGSYSDRRSHVGGFEVAIGAGVVMGLVAARVDRARARRTARRSPREPGW